MFLVGKLLTMLVLPTALMVECVVAGLLLRRWRVGRLLLGFGAASLLLCLLLPVDSWIIRPLEDRFPAVTTPPDTIDGIVVLGGAIEQGVANEAEYARILLEALDLPPNRVQFENTSRTTWENAVNTAALVHPQPGQRWILLTSASHMPRAVGVFRKAGWTVLPWPVGYQSRDHLTTYSQSLGQKLAVLDWGTHEWIGLLAYYLRGLSTSPFPAPDPQGKGLSAP